jgi:hypothetical protein
MVIISLILNDALVGIRTYIINIDKNVTHRETSVVFLGCIYDDGNENNQPFSFPFGSKGRLCTLLANESLYIQLMRSLIN